MGLERSMIQKRSCKLVLDYVIQIELTITQVKASQRHSANENRKQNVIIPILSTGFW